MILVLISIALKSLVIAGATLGLLELMKHRSAAERSWVAHVGLLALVLLALAPLVLPNWNLEAPALLGQTPTAEATIQSGPPMTTAASAPLAAQDVPAVAIPAPPRISISPAAAMTALYAVPAAILLFITFLALGRLITLRARADVLVDAHWLSALARAQRRMGFKHGTALLTSNELSSPISWGLMRPVILLNARAVEASGEAEAIIAHELAHVARMDWIKLLLARVATALFWFNPFVWLLAREAHQLREEAADDSVLAANISDTDYAELLVGVARHECPGLLLGAHGVAPSRKSLARRVARVLDGKSVRGPVARSFALGVLVGAVLVAAPLAALNLTPGGASTAAKPGTVGGSKASPAVTAAAPYYPATPPTDLPHIIASGVATSVQTAVAAVNPEKARQQARADAIADALATARDARADAIADAQDAAAEARTAIHARTDSDGQIDALIEMKAAGVTPEYVNAMRSISPQLRSMPPANFAGMKSVGVTPEFARELAAAGIHNLNANDLAAARSVGVTGDYARGMVSVGVPPNLGELIQLRAVGVPVPYVIQIRNSGVSVHNAEKVIEMWAVGVKPGDVRGLPSTNRGLPATPPRPPNPPNPNVEITIDTDGG